MKAKCLLFLVQPKRFSSKHSQNNHNGVDLSTLEFSNLNRKSISINKVTQTPICLLWKINLVSTCMQLCQSQKQNHNNDKIQSWNLIFILLFAINVSTVAICKTVVSYSH